MPTEVKAYACSFGCGQRLTKSKSRMAAHEKMCFHNPATRSCQTCANDTGHEMVNGKYTTICRIDGAVPTSSNCEEWTSRM